MSKFSHIEQGVVTLICASAIGTAGWIGSMLADNNLMTHQNQLALSTNSVLLVTTQKDIALIRQSQEILRVKSYNMSQRLIAVEIKVDDLRGEHKLEP